MSIEVSLVIPAYNEESNIEEAVDSAAEELSSFLDNDFEIIIVEDGCTDKTAEISERLGNKNENINHIHFEKRLGRGRALQAAFKQCKGDILSYMDADLATDLRSADRLIESIQKNEADISTGSRRINGSKVERSLSRSIASHFYNSIVQLTLDSNIKDHQCGFKALNKKVFEDLDGQFERDHWFWDTELLIRAQRSDYRVKEIPIEWSEEDGSKVDLLKDSLSMGSKIIDLYVSLKLQEREK